MNDPFTTRVRAAAVAGWWTVLSAVGFGVLLWIAYRLIISVRPAWVLSAWGPDITWSDVQPSATARWRRAYWRLVDSVFSSTWRRVDWRT